MRPPWSVISILYPVLCLAALCHWPCEASEPTSTPPAAFTQLGNEGALCTQAIARAEAEYHVPDGFLAAIARVESGRPDPTTGATLPYPWAVNAAGRSSFYPTKAGAIQAVRALQAGQVRLIDVGCLQVDLFMHPGAFTSLEDAFDPQVNADYAAQYLVALFGQTGSWPRAAAAYHSMTPVIGKPYEQHVLAEWAEPQADHRSASKSPPHLPRAQASAPAIVANIQAAPATPAGRMAAIITPQAGLAHPPALLGRNLASYRAMPARLAFRPLNPG